MTTSGPVTTSGSPAAVPRVSVVVPFRDDEHRLGACLAALADQTAFPECEILLADDGSHDASAALAKEFVALHPNARLADRAESPAHGTGARNRGLDTARGTYITWYGPDDAVGGPLPHDTVASLLRAADRSPDADPGDLTVVVRRPRDLPDLSDRVLDGIGEAADLIHSTGAGGKLFPLARVRSLGVRFSDDPDGDEAAFTVPLLLSARRIVLVDPRAAVPSPPAEPRPAGPHPTGPRPAEPMAPDRQLLRRTYLDRLALMESVAALRPGLSAGAHDALDRFLVRYHRGSPDTPHRLFDAGELRELFTRCRRVLGRVAPANVLAAAPRTAQRVPVLACLLDRFDLFARPDRTLRGLRARDGDLYLDLDLDDPDDELDVEEQHLLALTKVEHFHVRLEQCRPDGDALEVSGRYGIDGLPLAEPPAFTPALRVRGSGLTVPVEAMTRPDRTDDSGRGRWCGFRGRIPYDALLPGRHSLRLVVGTATGQASRVCLAAPGWLMDSRTVRTAGLFLLPHVDDGRRVVLEVAPGVTPADERAWRRSLLRRDLVHVLRRRPLWPQRLLRTLTAPLMRGRDIWLVGERHDTVQDNSGHLFRHLRKEARRPDVYYVIDRHSPDRRHLDGLGNVIAHSSWRHRFLSLHATRLINSYDIESYLLPAGWDRTHYLTHLGWRTGAHRVYLQHGVTYADISRGHHRARTGYDLILGAAPREGEYLAGHLDYRDTVRTTGFPRFDALTPDRGHRRVLFMPTWRRHLVSPSYRRTPRAHTPFEGSTYHRFLHAVLNHPGLRRALDTHGYVLEFLPHYEMRAATDRLLPPDGPFTLLDQTRQPVQDALRRCDLFITDSSSTSFDVAYLGTPLVYAQFDYAHFWATQYRKGYFDHPTDGFGPVCTTPDDTVRAITGYLERGCVREPLYDDRAAAFFPVRDQHNCHRVTEAVNSLGTPWR